MSKEWLTSKSCSQYLLLIIQMSLNDLGQHQNILWGPTIIMSPHLSVDQHLRNQKLLTFSFSRDQRKKLSAWANFAMWCHLTNIKIQNSKYEVQKYKNTKDKNSYKDTKIQKTQILGCLLHSLCAFVKICAAMLMIDPSKVKNEGDRWEKLVRWQM